MWLAALCILAGLTAVAVGALTVAKLWMRPVGAVGAGVIGDSLDRGKVLAGLLVLGSILLAALALVPFAAPVALLLAIMLIVGLVTCAVRATLERCDVPDQVKGLAIGGISLIGEAPDIYLPLIRGAHVDGIPGRWGYGIYSLAIASGAPPQQEPAKVLTAWNAT